MFQNRETPDDAYWVEVGGDGRMHPYGMHKTVNLDTVEVVNSISDEKNRPKRWVIIRESKQEVWVKVADQDAYGYDLRPDEHISAAELDAINLKHAALRDGSNVSVEEARTLVESGEPEQMQHALIALYYAAKADPDVTDQTLDSLREIVRKHTGHVDTGHTPTLKRILESTLGDDEGHDAT